MRYCEDVFLEVAIERELCSRPATQTTLAELFNSQINEVGDQSACALEPHQTRK